MVGCSTVSAASLCLIAACVLVLCLIAAPQALCLIAAPQALCLIAASQALSHPNLSATLSYCYLSAYLTAVLQVNVGLFDAVAAEGNVRAMFCGHDHYSDFVALRRGVYLCYGRVSSYTPPRDWEGSGH